MKLHTLVLRRVCYSSDFDHVLMGATDGGLYIFDTQYLLLQMVP